MKKFTIFGSQYFLLTIVVFIVLVIVIMAILIALAGAMLGLIIGVSLLIIMTGVLLVQSVVAVPETQNYILTFFGKWEANLKPGLNLVYPWFNLYRIPASFIVSEHSVDIFGESGDFKDMVEFKESAAWVRLSVRLAVESPKKAYTEVDDVYNEIISIFRKRFRDFAEDKDVYNLKEKDEDVDIEALFPVGDNKTLDYIKNNWGVEIKSIRLEDIIYSEEDRKARQEVFAERNKLSVVEFQNKQTVAKAKAKAAEIRLIAKAEKSSKRLEGEGFQQALNHLIDSNLSPQEASQFLQAIKKWEAVPNVQTGFFSDGQTSGSGMDKQAMAEIIAIANEINK